MDNEHLFKSVIASLVRHALTGIAGYFTYKGLLTNDQTEGLIVAAISGVIAIVWALWNKYKIGEKIAVALALPSGATPAQLDKAVEVKDEPVKLKAVAAEVRAERAGTQL